MVDTVVMANLVRGCWELSCEFLFWTLAYEVLVPVADWQRTSSHLCSLDIGQLVSEGSFTELRLGVLEQTD